jgi:hypothetical protein
VESLAAYSLQQKKEHFVATAIQGLNDSLVLKVPGLDRQTQRLHLSFIIPSQEVMQMVGKVVDLGHSTVHLQIHLASGYQAKVNSHLKACSCFQFAQYMRAGLWNCLFFSPLMSVFHSMAMSQDKAATGWTAEEPEFESW